jgi:cobalt-zinc-cadmium efflux system membrane fusion protein
MDKLGRLLALLVALAVGAIAATLVSQVPQVVRTIAELLPGASRAALRGQQDPPRHETAGDPTQQGAAKLKLTSDQITAAGIDVAAAGDGVLARRITVPGSVIANADRIARISVKLSGTVADLRKKLGDMVAKNEVVAVLESREVADAKSDYLAARLTDELQQELFERDKVLWEKHISNEQ